MLTQSQSATKHTNKGAGCTHVLRMYACTHTARTNAPVARAGRQETNKKSSPEQGIRQSRLANLQRRARAQLQQRQPPEGRGDRGDRQRAEAQRRARRRVRPGPPSAQRKAHRRQHEPVRHLQTTRRTQKAVGSNRVNVQMQESTQPHKPGSESHHITAQHITSHPRDGGVFVQHEKYIGEGEQLLKQPRACAKTFNL